ncbi:MAG TPA: hypothetical protein DCZ91_02505 [Lachnospiraceae bacterium]|nr:hypothetical protein [Lachnospiraceae bacterium]
MDKVTRILMLYSRLMQGEVVNKTRFCLETECSSRSFDRDIEDIRLYLSESYSAGELWYDRWEGGYLLTEAMQPPLEDAEYLLVEKVLSDSGVLRKDEMDELLLHIALHTKNARRATVKEKHAIDRYIEPEHGKPLLKMVEDLNAAIDSHQVIRIYGDKFDPGYRNIIPCEIRCYDKKIWLLALAAEKDAQELLIPLEEIESFSIIRNQSIKEKQQTESCVKI